MGASRLACLGLVLLPACGRIGFDALNARGDAVAPTDNDALGPPPTAHISPPATVTMLGDPVEGNTADGTHMVFIDNTPGEAGDLVIFREGENTATPYIDTSNDGGVTWTEYGLGPSNTAGINALGACQDTVDHAFHVSWLDTSDADQYARLMPVYLGGHITGFSIVANFGFFDDGGDSPSPRDLAEVVDISGNHRLLFSGAGPATGSTGRYKLAVTTPTVGLAPASQNDWAKATDYTALGTDDQLLPNNYPSSDTDTTYMVSVSSNVAGGSSAPILVLAGLPADRKLLAWTITPTTGDDFAVSAAQTLTTAFGGGTGLRRDSSLSLVNAPAGTTWFAYSEDGTSTAPGVHVGTLDTAGRLMLDSLPQPTTNAAARHAVIGANHASQPGMFYADGSGNLLATLAWGSAWLPAVHAATLPTPVAAWSLSDAWQPSGIDTFGVYCDNGSAAKATFSAVGWQ